MTTLTPSTTAPDALPTDGDGDATARRDRRFAEGIRALRAGSATFRLDERVLMVLGGVLVPLGLIVVLLGWWGAAHSPYVFDQIPYVISGGLLGVGMIFLGGFLYFAHWLTQMVQDNRRQASALLDALQRLEEHLTVGSATGARASSATNGAAVHPTADQALVATARGTMAHRRDCAVVAGKSGLRTVSASDGLAVCKLCGPA